MDSLFRKIFNRHFFSERILFLAISGGMLLDGWVLGVYDHFSADPFLRISVGFFSAVALAYTYTQRPAQWIVRMFACISIGGMISFSAWFNVVHHFDFENALTLLGVYIVCSLYFRKMPELALYLFLGFVLQSVCILITKDPLITPSVYVLRNFFAACMVFGLSYSTRRFQQHIQSQSEKVSRENLSLIETKNELEARLSHEHLLSLVASRANAAVIICNSKGEMEWVNDRFTEMFGYSAAEVSGKKITLLHGAGTSGITLAKIEKRKKELAPFHETILEYDRNGKPIWVQMHVAPLTDENGNTERFIAIQEDISGIKNTEEQLIRSKEQLKAAQEQAKIGSWEWEDGNDFITVSDEMARILGITGRMNSGNRITIDEVYGQVHPDDLEKVKLAIENGLKMRTQFETGFRGYAEGKLKHVYLTAKIYRHERSRAEKLVGTLQDITERKRIEEEMHLAEKQYRSLFENSQHMIIMHDLDGVIMSINQSGTHSLEYEPEEVIGRNIRQFFFSDDADGFANYMSGMKTGGTASGLIRAKMKRGGTKVWLYNNVIIKGPKGDPCVLSSNVDFTSRMDLEKELRKAKKAAEEALQMKDRFVANISHELRTPMNAIVGFTELLIKTKLSKEQEEYIGAVHLAGTNLTTMINDVLDLAKIEAGKIEFESHPFSIRKVMEETHLLLSQSAAQTGIEFEWKCETGIPLYIMGDDHRLSQILINLVGNAIKFTEKGFVRFSAHLIREDDESVNLELLVVDTGIGIPEKKLKDIFEPFVQSSTESTRKYGGTGLGLSIVRDLVQLQGGTVEVKSENSKGSIFRVFLSFRKVGQDVVQKVEQALSPGDSPGKINILIVEDQQLNQQLASRLIADFGFTCEIASNGIAATGILRSSPNAFDVILMDLQMPEMDGYEATRIIRQELHLEIPIVAVTAHSSAGERERCLQLGMNDYLSKPYRAQDFYFRIVSALKKNPPATAAEIDEENPLRSLAGGDKKFEQEMIGLMLRSIPEEFSRLENAIDKNDQGAAKAAAHRLKSSVALAGEKELAKIFDEMENDQKKRSAKIIDEAREKKSRLILKLEKEMKDF
ncbi:MAG: PAS domain S-box protein [Bacteroidetes bacterium]|nr:PAS domain S-box protein [Bacteroidota bacterium]